MSLQESELVHNLLVKKEWLITRVTCFMYGMLRPSEFGSAPCTLKFNSSNIQLFFNVSFTDFLLPFTKILFFLCLIYFCYLFFWLTSGNAHFKWQISNTLSYAGTHSYKLAHSFDKKESTVSQTLSCFFSAIKYIVLYWRFMKLKCHLMTMTSKHFSKKD